MNLVTHNKNNITTDYLVHFETLFNEKIKKIKKTNKIEGELTNIPTFDDHLIFLTYNYNVKQLRQIANKYKIKITGTKTILIGRIYTHLYLSFLASNVQKIFRGRLTRKYNSLRGPALKNRKKCTNGIDFLSMDDVCDIPHCQFFSFQDDDGFIFGFDILSLYNLVNKHTTETKNPFSQKKLSNNIIKDFGTLLRISKILKIKIITKLPELTNEISKQKSLEMRAITLFQKIDELGNYTNASWFLNLTREKLIKFARELLDIWEYRANLNIDTKIAICHPTGKPFRYLPEINSMRFWELDIIREKLLCVMEQFVTCGIDNDNKCLGANYVLCSLTLVNQEVAMALPWLYEAAHHM